MLRRVLLICEAFGNGVVAAGSSNVRRTGDVDTDFKFDVVPSAP